MKHIEREHSIVLRLAACVQLQGDYVKGHLLVNFNLILTVVKRKLILYLYFNNVALRELGRSVGVENRLRAGRSGIRIPAEARIFLLLQTISKAQPTSYSVLFSFSWA
jgi:hypothetical protein